MGIDSSRLTLVKTFLIGIEGSEVSMKEVLQISFIINIYRVCVTIQLTFMIINMTLSYNVIIGRSLLYNINEVTSI